MYKRFTGERTLLWDGVVYNIVTWTEVDMQMVHELFGVPEEVKVNKYILSIQRMIEQENYSYSLESRQLGVKDIHFTPDNKIQEVIF